MQFARGKVGAKHVHVSVILQRGSVEKNTISEDAVAGIMLCLSVYLSSDRFSRTPVADNVQREAQTARFGLTADSDS